MSAGQLSIVYLLKPLQNHRLSFNTSVASTLPVIAGVTPITPLGGEACVAFLLHRDKGLCMFWGIAVVENGYLAFKATDGSVDVGFSLFYADFIDQITRGKIVAPIHNYIIITDKFACIVFI